MPFCRSRLNPNYAVPVAKMVDGKPVMPESWVEDDDDADELLQNVHARVLWLLAPVRRCRACQNEFAPAMPAVIKQLREEHHLTQRQLASALGVTEMGSVPPALDCLIANRGTTKFLTAPHLRRHRPIDVFTAWMSFFAHALRYHLNTYEAARMALQQGANHA